MTMNFELQINPDCDEAEANLARNFVSPDQKLLMSLATSESEDAVMEILKTEGYWDDEEVWQNIGDMEGNAGVIQGQADHSENALVEKVTNSIDHVLIGECKQRGIPINGSAEEGTPQTMQEATEKFFNIKDGLLTNITPTERTIHSERIKLIATGEKFSLNKKPPCLIIADNGEGQSPASFAKTLLSLNKSNKNNIPFVQGKFNMGGTAALRFCGKESLQLILSKKNPEINDYEDDESHGDWGFTITRRFPPKRNERNYVYKYLAPKGKVLSFRANELMVLPSADAKKPKAYELPMKHGTFVKLYDYDLDNKGLILARLFYRLSLLLPDIALPVRLYETRQGYEGNTLCATLAGLSVRLKDDKEKNLESEPISIPLTLKNDDKIKGTLYVFKKEDGQSGRLSYAPQKEGVVFTINGQTHGDIRDSFFSGAEVGLSYLADSLLIVLDCSDIDPKLRLDSFKPSRDRVIAKTPFVKEVKSELVRTLKEGVIGATLRDLANKRRMQEMSDNVNDKKISDTLKKIFQTSPTLAKFLGTGKDLSNPFNPNKNTKDEDIVDVKEYPDYFELKKKYLSDKPREHPINSDKIRIKYETNARNDYFIRNQSAGGFSLFLNGEVYKNFDEPIISNGSAILTIHPSDDWIEGDKLEFKSIVKDDVCIHQFEETFFIHVVKARPKIDTPNSTSRGSLQIPEPIPVREKQWIVNGFDKNSALKIEINPASGGYDFKINMDNIYFLTEQKSRKDKFSAEILEKVYMLGMVLFGLSQLSEHFESDKTEGGEELDKVAKNAEGFARVLIPILCDVGGLITKR